jgi:hypothetical protein
MKTRTMYLTHVAPGCSSIRGEHYHPNRITLPAEPWGYEPAPDYARPTMPPIRGNANWRQDVVLRHADARRDRG